MQAFKAALRVVLSHPVYIVVYAVWLSIMGVFIASSLSIGAEGDEFTAVKTPFAVIDRDQSEISRSLTTYLGEHAEQVHVADEPFAMQDAVATGQVQYLLVVPEGYGAAFQDAALSGAKQPTMEATFSYETLASQLVDQQVSQYLGLARTAIALEPDASLASALARADAAAIESAQVETVKTPDGSTPSDRFAFYLQWGAYTITASVIVCVSVLMSAFNRTDVRRRNLVSPVSNMRMGLQKALACLLVTVLMWAVSCGMGLAAFGYTLEGIPLGAIVLTLACAFVFSLVPLSIGFLLGQLGVSETVSNAVGNITGMVMSFLGGAWISLDLMPPAIQTLSRFIPTFWYTDAVGKAIHLTDMTFEAVAPALESLGIVALFAVALFAIALAAGRIRQRSAEAGGNAAASAI